jgi:riboflavin synthase
MFTGLVEATGTVEAVEPGGMSRLVVAAGEVADGVRVGDSVSVNGVCLTVSEASAGKLTFYAMPETLRRTALGTLSAGSAVNLERAMSPQSRFGGHIVQGHVDGVGEVLGVRPEGGAEIWEFRAPEAVLRYTVEKGSVCVDGISLTVVAVGDGSFTVSILPQTKEATNLGHLGVGDLVNLEADVIGKYVERLLGPRLGRVEQTERSVEDAV